MDLIDPLDVLRKYFNHNSFRPKQKEIIQSVLDCNDTIVIMSTGSGKSICFQVPALLLDGLTIVISPLIALMKDQVQTLKDNGVNAEFLNSSQTDSVQNKIIQQMKNGELKLVYISPERLKSDLDLLLSLNISLFAIDEAHCICQWGHDFRPDYLNLCDIKKNFPDTPVIALTASADTKTQDHIISKLGLKDPSVFISSFNRPNIHYTVKEKQDSVNSIISFIKSHLGESGIIYCLSRNSCEIMAEKLLNVGIKADYYHAGMTTEERTRIQDNFKNNQVQIIVATIAFGMGIDKPNVRFVIHYDMPKSIEGYYQETGRAGRDGLKSEAILYYAHNDVFKLKRLIKTSDKTFNETIFKKLDAMSKFASAQECRRRMLLNYFGEDYDQDNCASCDYCLKNKSDKNIETFDGTEYAQKIIDAIEYFDERFGQTMIIDFIYGANTKKMTDEYRKSELYGSGSDITKKEWALYLLQLIEQGLIQRTSGEYPILKLEDNVRENGLDQQIFLKRNLPNTEKVKGNGSRNISITGWEDGKYIKKIVKERDLDEIIRGRFTETINNSYKLWKSGKNIAEIAQERNLVESTISSHLATFISSGEIHVSELMNPEKIPAIIKAIKKCGLVKKSEIIETLGENYSYSELNNVIEYCKLPINIHVKCKCGILSRFTIDNDESFIGCDANKCDFKEIISIKNVLENEKKALVHCHEFVKDIQLQRDLASFYEIFNKNIEEYINIDRYGYCKMYIYTDTDTEIIKIYSDDIISELKDYDICIKKIRILYKYLL
jgi:ATP-dependent DNA helicase RecQ